MVTVHCKTRGLNETQKYFFTTNIDDQQFCNILSHGDAWKALIIQKHGRGSIFKVCFTFSNPFPLYKMKQKVFELKTNLESILEVVLKVE